MTHSEPVLSVAAAVADGDDIDWQRAENAATSADDREDVRQLYVIAEIARLHRRLSGAPADQSRSATGDHQHPPTPTRDRNHLDGPRWGPLVVLEKLGAGAFGDVYRAWDTTLDREVALKLLRKRARGRTESIMREGQLLARISHPNVMAIHGALEVDSQVGIWGEFLRGRTLARLVRDDGPLSADEALVVSESICRALAAVHKASLLHRDVKAQNVMRERGGRIVLMDFGLGQQLDEIGAEPTIDLAGTPLYLAPELFAGGRPSIQSDLYSLGVLMFFLATGKYPVTGSSLSEIGRAHGADRRARLQDLRPELPTAFVQVVERALQPDPNQRFESAGVMQAAITAAHQPLRQSPQSRGLAALREPAVAAAIAIAGIASAGTAWLVTTALRPTITTRSSAQRLVSLEAPVGSRFSDSARNMPAISPDGRYVAFSATDLATGTINLWLHSFATADVKIVAGSQGALAPFWSPNSKDFGFFEPGGTIKRITVDGVPLGSIDTGQEPRGATINGRGLLLYTKGPRSGLYAIATTGAASEERLVISPDGARGELGLTWPQFLPDGERFIYLVLSNKQDVRGIYLASLARPIGRLLANTDASAVLAGNRLIYVKGGDLVAHQFDPETARTEGTPTPIVPTVSVGFDWRSTVSAADDGTLVYLPAQEGSELVWLDRTGTERGKLELPVARYRSPAISRDGRLLALQRYRDGLSEIEVVDLETGRARPSLAHSADVQFPVWGPGHQLAYASGDTGRMDVYIKDFERDDPPRRLELGAADPKDSDKMPTDWSSDGKHLLVVDRSTDRRYNLWVLPVDELARAAPLRPGEGSQYGGRLSPDNRSAIYVRRVRPLRDGAPPERELWACDFPSGTNPRLIATGGIDPAWPSNDIVSFLDRTGKLTLLRPGALRPAQQPVATFTTGIETPEGSRNSYAWSPDGSRVLVNRPLGHPDRRRVMVLLPGEQPATSGSSTSVNN